MHAEPGEFSHLRDYLEPLRRRWWVVLLVAAATTAAAYAYEAAKPKHYAASTTVYLNSSSPVADVGVAGGAAPGGDADRLVRNQAVLLRTGPVARRVARRIGYSGDPVGLLQSITVAPVDGTDFLTISARGPNAQGAADIANAFARAFIEVRGTSVRDESAKSRRSAERRLARLPLGQDNEARKALQARIQRLRVIENLGFADVQQIDRAVAPGTPEGPSPTRDAVFALVLALLVGCGLAYGLGALDRRLRRVGDLGPLYGLPVLVGLPRARRALKRNATSLVVARPLREPIRALRTTLQYRATALSPGTNGHAPRTIQVTSALPREGKSTVVRNLALAYLEAGLRVVLVDADLREPTVARSFGVDPVPGLTDVLVRGQALDGALVAVEGASSEIVRRRPEPASVAAGWAVAATPEPVHFRPRPRPSRFGLGRPAPRDPVTTVRPPSPGSGPAPAEHQGGLWVLPSGSRPGDPAAVLASGGLEPTLRELAARFDVVIIDSSPVLAVSDPVPLLSSVDGVVLVARLNLTTHKAVDQLNEVLNRVPRVNVLGVVANDLRESTGMYAFDYGRVRRAV
jgi:Mrp family chromosome partitioning ATPase